MIATYTIAPVPQPELSRGRVWDVFGGTEPYVVKCDAAGEWCCSCPNWCKSPGGRRERLRRDGGCKHIHRVRCSIGDHKFMDSLTADGGQECVRCGVSVAQHEYETYGPPDEPFTPDRRDY